MNEMMQILNIRHHLITAYHPQADKIKREGVLSRSASKCNSGLSRVFVTMHLNIYFIKEGVSNVMGVR